ncbi:hypothetical protein XCCB1459_0547 [Xanthomonas campestris pv. campestris]|nr:hypothetical protein XCCB1459_0547 [Xanthomonas campestris pv. campestris]
MHAADPVRPALPKHHHGLPVLLQHFDQFDGFLWVAPVAQKIRRTDGQIRLFIVLILAASAGTLPNQRPRDGFEFFTRASPYCSK